MASFSGISVRLPMHRDGESGIALTKTISENTRQNLKMLLLTSPGERLMEIDYGVGVRRMLFDPKPSVIKNLTTRIRSQVKTFMPYITIMKLEIFTSEMGDLSNFLKQVNLSPGDSDAYTLGISIRYRINRAATDDWIIIATGTSSDVVPYIAFAQTLPFNYESQL